MGVFGMFQRILEKGLNESCHDRRKELCEVLGFMRKPWGAVVVGVRGMFDAGEVKGKGFYYMGL